MKQVKANQISTMFSQAYHIILYQWRKDAQWEREKKKRRVQSFAHFFASSLFFRLLWFVMHSKIYFLFYLSRWTCFYCQGKRKAL